MEYKDYYKTLGVSKTATGKEIKSAFRKLAQKYHPDRNQGNKQAEERFKQINEAYEVLGDADKRAKYDELGSSYAQWEQMGRPGGGFDFSQWASAMGRGGGARRGDNVRVEYQNLDDLFGDSGFSDFFETLFGGSFSRTGRAGSTARTMPRAAPSQPIEQPVDISLEEAYAGTTRVLQRGETRKELKIPPGAKTGTKIRFAGGGSPAASPIDGSTGDLYLVVNVTPHSKFRREGDDLHTDLHVEAQTAILGGEVRVPTLGGEVVLTLPPETQAGKTFRLSGRGMPRLRRPQEHGDLYAHIVITIPQHLSEAERKLIAEWAALRRSGK